MRQVICCYRGDHLTEKSDTVKWMDVCLIREAVGSTSGMQLQEIEKQNPDNMEINL